MKQHRFLFSLLTLFVGLAAQAKSIRFQVDAGSFDRQDCAVSLDVSAYLKKNSTRVPYLSEIRDGQRLSLPCQLVFQQDGSQSLLCFVLQGHTPARSSRQFELSFGKAKTTEQPAMTVLDNQESLVLSQQGRPVLSYRYTLAPVPEGVDPVFRRSGFIHPAWTPSGFVLTAIQPRDHRHHYGIWNPWTHLVYDGKLYDLWNLGDKLGTVRATAVDATYQGPVVAGFDALLDHVIFAPAGEKTVMKEKWMVRAWQSAGGFLWDFESQLTPSGPQPVLLQEYRYAGFGYRANEVWTNQNCMMMTSEGHSRQQIDGTRARWIYVTGDSPAGRSGLLLMEAPRNYNSPEPLRIWNEEANGGRGDVFINFAPTKNTDWQLEPGQTYRLCYRLFAYDGEMTPQRAEQLWQDFAHPPKVWWEWAKIPKVTFE